MSTPEHPTPEPIVEQIDLGELEALQRHGLVAMSEHPELPLTICTYTAQRQIEEREWTPLLEICRGLVIDPDGVIVARPFRRMHEIMPDEQLPPGSFTAYEKLDGSMGVQYPTPEGPRIATRGNFVGRQAVRGSQLLEPYRDFPFGTGVTPVWEIIYPENRIVVDYGDREELVLTGLIETATGRELELPDQAAVPFKVVNQVEGVETADDLRALETPNAEGFVVRMEETGDRYKVKFPAFEYFAKIRRGTMKYSIWVKLLNGQNAEEYLETVPAGARDAVAAEVAELQERYTAVEQRVRAAAADPNISIDKQLLPAVQRVRRGQSLPEQLLWEAVRPPKNPSKPHRRKR